VTTSSNEKRLDEIESQLTPKEWVIREIQEIRRHPGLPEYVEELIKKGQGHRKNPFDVFEKQADERHPGRKPEDITARNQLLKKLNLEFLTLRDIGLTVNNMMRMEAGTSGLQAALKLSQLQTLILQDAFGRTARKAALWVEEYKTADKDEEENRQLMLKELSAYADVNFGERFSDSIAIGQNLRLRFPSMIEEWIRDTVHLIGEIFSHETAVRMIEKKFFDGHPILSRDVETMLNNAIKTVQDGAATFNEYLKTRADLFKNEWDEEEKEDGITSAIPGEREGKLSINIDAIKDEAGRSRAAVMMESWIKMSRAKAQYDVMSPEESKGWIDQAGADLLGIKS
jgi:hypothetical protein